MINKEDIFQARFSALNDRQKEAVESIYGAVMVIAGPGTGKTEVLSMRIANLLRSDVQVQPHEILCLTYTEEATNSMRKRLVQIIGPEAHRVNIFTFHAFCNNVIQNSSYYFSQFADHDLQPISDIERIDLIYELLEELPSGHKLRKLSGNIYADTKRLARLFDEMKKEYIQPRQLSDSIDEYIASLPTNEEYIYKRNGKGYEKGDLKQSKIDEEVRRVETTKAAATLFDAYRSKMLEKRRYDFHDMIIWVLEAFQNQSTLLQSYQERYQFILVDEFQDTNGSQNELLNALASYWDDPNIFVVGDDDQGVYEFQGARIRNIIDFYEKYKADIKIIVLSENYRSSQLILNIAMRTINENKQRLITKLADLNLNKNIVSAAGRFKHFENNKPPVVKIYQNVFQEETDIVAQIEALQKLNVPLNEVAVLYAQHKQADNIMSILERKGIPYNAKKTVNVLENLLVIQILNVLKYLQLEQEKIFRGEETLFEIMHAPYFGILPSDIARIALYMQTAQKETGPLKWKLVLSNHLLFEALNLKSATNLDRLGKRLDEWEQQLSGLPLPLLVEKILHESGIIAHVVRTTDHVWTLQMLNTFFEFVKDTYAKSPRIKISEFLEMINRMNREGIPLPAMRVIQNEHGVNFYTAHGSKGNEFEYVYLVGCTRNFWEDKKGSNNEYKLPENLTETVDDVESTHKIEVSRRLFYVALTRAKKHLNISYSKQDYAGKALMCSRFVDEIVDEEEKVNVPIDMETAVEQLITGMRPVEEVKIKIANAEWVERVLQQFIMSATSLSKFLRCPLSFYFENILKVPFQKNDALAFGNAVHNALEKLFKEMLAKKGTFPDKKQFIEYFKKALFLESSGMTAVHYERRMEQGETMLSEYYDANVENAYKEVEIEFKVPRYILSGVPVTGKIDKIEFHGTDCYIIDYKTGDPDKSSQSMLAPPNEKEKDGGDYWRQMVFYKLLLENFAERNWVVKEGYFEFIQKDKHGKYKKPLVPVFKQDEEFVLGQLKDVYSKIMNHEFDRGCGEENCHWCNFAKRYELIRESDIE